MPCHRCNRSRYSHGGLYADRVGVCEAFLDPPPPPPPPPEPFRVGRWFETLGLTPGADREAILRRRRDLLMRHHPDRPGGDTVTAQAINAAADEGLRMQQRRSPRGFYWGSV